MKRLDLVSPSLEGFQTESGEHFSVVVEFAVMSVVIINPSKLSLKNYDCGDLSLSCSMSL